MNRLNKITVYCGSHQYIPPCDKASMTILGQVYETQAEMSAKGAKILRHLMEPSFGFDRFFFTNNDNAMEGLRVAVKGDSKTVDICDRVRIVHFSPIGKRSEIYLDNDGNYVGSLPFGFFGDQTIDDLTKLF